MKSVLLKIKKWLLIKKKEKYYKREVPKYEKR